MTKEEHNACFEQWLSSHAGVLHHVANGFAEGADRQDLFQELMVALWKAVPAFRQGAKPSTFIYRVAHNVALTWKRTQKNYRRKVDAYSADAVPQAAESACASGEQETLQLVYAEIRRMPPVDRSLILLHLDGVGYAEIAELHGLSESNVGVRLTRLRQRLTQALKEVSRELR